MKRTKKILVGFLACLSVLCGSLGLAGCDETYTTKETDELLAELEQTIAENKSDLDEKIAEMKSAYEAELAVLQATDEANADKIAELVSKITALEQATRVTDVKFEENGDLTITFGDGTTKTVKAPEQHVHSFGEWTAFTADDVPCENRLFFHTCTECGTIEWKQGAYADHDFTTVTTDPTCQAQGYDTKTCEICGKVETVNPTPIVDHAWATEYSHDNSYHWIDCETCDEFKDKQEHSVLSSGECSVCGELVGATEGIVYDVSNGEAQVVMYEGTAKRVRIADTYQGAPVTKIANGAFKNSAITSIVIPDSVTSIGDNAFYECTSLTSIEIPDSVTSIGDYAFIYCGSLTSVYITSIEAWCNISFANQSANPLYIVHNLYLNNELITELEIPDSVASIGEYAFSQYRSLISVTISEGIASIGDHAFSYCKSLTSVTIGDDVTSIGDYAFTDCSSLMSVTIGENVTSISSSAFRYCSSLQFNEYGNAKYLGSKTNAYFALIETKSKNFSSYTIHNDTKVIADGVFSNCSSLTSVYISDIEAWCKISFSGHSANPLYYAKNLYLNNELVTKLEIPNTITEIKDYAFYDCDSLTSIEIPDSVTSIGNHAFYNCGSLTSVVIGDGVTSIGNSAFSYCSSLTSVTIGDSVTSIGDYAFYNCDSLTSVTFEDTSTWYRTYNYIDWQNKTGGTQMDVSYPSNNASYFVNNSYYWYKL